MRYDTKLQEQISSIDFLLRGYDGNMPIYSCPLFVTKKYDNFFTGNLLFNPEGFFVKNDTICASKLSFMGQEHLYLKGVNRFYAIYLADETNYVYTFYSLLSCEKLYAYLKEMGEGVGDSIAKVVSSLDETEILGMVCVESRTSDKEAVFSLLLSKPFTSETCRLFDALTVKPTMQFDTNSFTLYFKIVLAYSFVHDLKKYSGQENALIMMNDSEAESFKSYLDKNYDLLPEEQRNECVLLYTDRKCVRSKVAQDFMLKVCVLNLFNKIKCYGIDGFLSSYTILGDTKCFNLGKLVGQTIFNNKQSAFSLEDDYQLPLVLALVFVNLQYPNQPGIKNPIGVWLYYLLYKIRKSCTSDELPFINTLLEFTLYNNFKVYCMLLGQVKSQIGISEYFDENGFLWCDWRNKQSNVAVCELFYLFTNCLSQRTQFSEYEKKIWSATLDKELDREDILDVLKDDVGHSQVLPQEREYFAEELFQFIERRIEDGDFYFKEFY